MRSSTAGCGTAATLALALGACAPEPASPGVGSVGSALVDARRTAIVGLHAGRGGSLAIAFVVAKHFPFDPIAARTGDADVRIEVFDALGRALGAGEARLPRLCPCSGGDPHFDGDVELAHEATVLVKVPLGDTGDTLRVHRRAAGGVAWETVLTVPAMGGGGAR